jgi:hypothetical protein
LTLDVVTLVSTERSQLRHSSEEEVERVKFVTPFVPGYGSSIMIGGGGGGLDCCPPILVV